MKNSINLNETLSHTHLYDPKNLIMLFCSESKDKEKQIVGKGDVLFVLKGECSIEYDCQERLYLKQGQGVPLIENVSYNLRMKAETEVIKICLNLFKDVELYNFIKETFQEEDYIALKENQTPLLTANKILQKYLENLTIYLKDGIDDSELFLLKTKELLLILFHYSKSEIYPFLQPLLNKEKYFEIFILKSWNTVKSVEELADISGHCKIEFNEKFKSIFGVAPQKWLDDKKLI